MGTTKTNELKSGAKILLDGNPCSVISHEHIQPGKGQAFVRVNYRQLLTGRSLEKTFKSGETIELADVAELDLQYLYSDSEFWHFMDANTFDQYQADANAVGDKHRWLSEQDQCLVTLWNGRAINVELPNFVTLEVSHTEPGLKGDTSGTANKPATLSTGAIILVPLFVVTGDVLKIDTRTGEYVSRSK